MAQISFRLSFSLDLPPSCIVFCPSQPEYCVIGTYFLHPKESPRGSNNAIDDRGSEDKATEQSTTDEDLDEDEVIRDEAPQKRTGSLIVYHVDSKEPKMTEACTLKTPYAVLDAQWSPHQQHRELLAVAASTGQILLYKLENSENSKSDINLILINEIIVADPSILVLSLSWHPQNPEIIGYTLSNGDVSLCTIITDQWTSSSSTPTPQLHTIHTHTLEAWTLSFAPQINVILSGGDDQTLKSSPLPPSISSTATAEPPETANQSSTTSPSWQDSRVHSAGVTAILPLPDVATSGLVVTGSYDDCIRLVRVPGLASGGEGGYVRKRCQVLAEMNLGGGVWRLKRIPSFSDEDERGGVSGRDKAGEVRILASCMHAGARIVSLRRCRDGGDEVGVEDGEAGWEFEVLARLEEHESMNYGSDVQPVRASYGGQCTGGGSDDVDDGSGKLRDIERRRTVVSMSFYDKKVCLWQFQP